MSKIKNHRNKEIQKKLNSEWYSLRPILGYANWAMFFILLGGREAGKSYSVTNFFVDQFVNKGIPFYWLRLTDRQTEKLLNNNADRLVDPDLRRKYNLDLVTNGMNVYAVERGKPEEGHPRGRILKKRLMARVLSLSTLYTDKGALFDKDFLNDEKMRYNIAVDEFQREKNERNTFDILYALVNQLENIVRSTKNRVRVFFMGNTLEEASDILCAFKFIPEDFGIFKLKSKRAVMHNIAPTEEYKARRKGSIADILMPTASTFTNKIDTDKALISKKPRKRLTAIIKFSKDKNDWFSLWDGDVISKWKNHASKDIYAMRPYLDERYNIEKVKSIFERFDSRNLKFQNLITFKEFEKNLSLLRPQR